jgi:hypothetical protein
MVRIRLPPPASLSHHCAAEYLYGRKIFVESDRSTVLQAGLPRGGGFPPGNIKATFEQVREVLEREKVIDPLPKPAGAPLLAQAAGAQKRLLYTHPLALKE